jgi:hypothetical protein
VHIISQKFGESSLTLKAEKDKAATLACWAETKIVVSHVGPPVTTTGAAAFGAAAGPTTSCRPPLYIHTRTLAWRLVLGARPHRKAGKGSVGDGKALSHPLHRRRLHSSAPIARVRPRRIASRLAGQRVSPSFHLKSWRLVCWGAGFGEKGGGAG